MLCLQDMGVEGEAKSRHASSRTQGQHPDRLASLGSSGSPRPPPALRFWFRLQPRALAYVQSQGSAQQDSALETIFSPSLKPQPFLAPGACLPAQPHGMGTLLQSPRSDLQSWLWSRKMEEDYPGSGGRRGDVPGMSGLWQAARGM